VTLQNGVPWWYFHKLPGAFEGRPVAAADPDGSIARHIDNERIIGTVVYPASELVSPGVVKVIEGNRFTLGEPDGSKSDRVQRLVRSPDPSRLQGADRRRSARRDLDEAMGQCDLNPVSALSHGTLAGICGFPLTRDLAAKMMAETQAVAEKLGVRFRISIDKRIAGAEAVGEHKTSMLQDVEAGRAPELEALVGSVVEMARLTETPTPHVDAIYAVTSLLAKVLAERKGRLEIQPAG